MSVDLVFTLEEVTKALILYAHKEGRLPEDTDTWNVREVSISWENGLTVVLHDVTVRGKKA